MRGPLFPTAPARHVSLAWLISVSALCVASCGGDPGKIDDFGRAQIVSFDARFHRCPHIQTFVALPLIVSLDREIWLNASAETSDERDPPQFFWTATAGEFADASASSTAYYCSSLGTQIITLTLSNQDCDVTASVAVHCMPNE